MDTISSSDGHSRTDLYFKVYGTTLEMLHDRGYKIKEEDKELNYVNFSNRLEGNKINITAYKDESELNGIYVNYILNSKTFNKKDLQNLRTFIDENYPTKKITVLIIVQDKPTPQIAKELLNDEYNLYEIFLTKMLMFNITHHHIVPKHTILNEEDSKKILNSFDATKNQLPKLLSTDPVAKYYGMKSGDICKITRNSPMTGESIYYRIVK
jgi:DNA-directed RNA polymerase I, II, and III subunit RPABC1